MRDESACVAGRFTHAQSCRLPHAAPAHQCSAAPCYDLPQPEATRLLLAHPGVRRSSTTGTVISCLRGLLSAVRPRRGLRDPLRHRWRVTGLRTTFGCVRGIRGFRLTRHGCRSCVSIATELRSACSTTGGAWPGLHGSDLHFVCVHFVIAIAVERRPLRNLACNATEHQSFPELRSTLLIGMSMSCPSGSTTISVT